MLPPVLFWSNFDWKNIYLIYFTLSTYSYSDKIQSIPIVTICCHSTNLKLTLEWLTEFIKPYYLLYMKSKERKRSIKYLRFKLKSRLEMNPLITVLHEHARFLFTIAAYAHVTVLMNNKNVHSLIKLRLKTLQAN